MTIVQILHVFDNSCIYTKFPLNLQAEKNPFLHLEDLPVNEANIKMDLREQAETSTGFI
jgi:hypothetical protein